MCVSLAATSTSESTQLIFQTIISIHIISSKFDSNTHAHKHTRFDSNRTCGNDNGNNSMFSKRINTWNWKRLYRGGTRSKCKYQQISIRFYLLNLCVWNSGVFSNMECLRLSLCPCLTVCACALVLWWCVEALSPHSILSKVVKLLKSDTILYFSTHHLISLLLLASILLFLLLCEIEVK